MDVEGKNRALGIPQYLRKAWLKALLLGQGRWCQTCMLGIEQVTCIHIKRWDLSCSTSGRAIQLVPASQHLPATKVFIKSWRCSYCQSCPQSSHCEKEQHWRAGYLKNFGIFSSSPQNLSVLHRYH